MFAYRLCLALKASEKPLLARNEVGTQVAKRISSPIVVKRVRSVIYEGGEFYGKGNISYRSI